MTGKNHAPHLPSQSENARPMQNFGRLLRRRALPLATTAAAALSMAGCAMGGSAQEAAPGGGTFETVAPNPNAQRVAADRVREFTSNIDAALDQVDRERLRAAADKAAAEKAASDKTALEKAALDKAAPDKKTLAAAQTPSAAPLPATSAPVSSTAVQAAQTPVVLASLTDVGASAATPAIATVPLPTPSTPAPVLPPAAATALISPIAPPPKSTPSAMGAMTAMATVIPEAAAPVTVVPAAPVAAPTPAEPTVDEAIAVLRKHVPAHPTLNSALALALLDSSSATPADLGKGLSDADQKIFTDLLAALQNLPAGSTGASISDRAAPLVEAAKKWQANADLTLPLLALATRVDSFGVYTAVDAKFAQGQKHTVIIYCEVANFTSKKTDDGWYQTRLSQQETLITDDGLMVWRPNAEDVEDRSRNQRRDFYLVKKLTIPDTLPVGNYTLRMSVNDLNSGKIAIISLPIEINNK